MFKTNIAWYCLTPFPFLLLLLLLLLLFLKTYNHQSNWKRYPFGHNKTTYFSFSVHSNCRLHFHLLPPWYYSFPPKTKVSFLISALTLFMIHSFYVIHYCLNSIFLINFWILISFILLSIFLIFFPNRRILYFCAK